MHEKQSASSGYQISHIKVFPNLNVIEVMGQAHRVEPKVMMLLNYLAKHQGQVCSKQDLIDEIWPNQVIADEALTRLIFVLRNVLGDDAKAPKFISTVPKKGYVLLQPVTSIKSKKVQYRLLLTVLALIIFLVTVAYIYHQPSPEYKVIRTTPITFQEGREYGFIQGKELSAYFHQYNGVTKLMVAKGGDPYQTLVDDEWQKRSLQIINNTLFYVRFNDNESQIIRQTLLTGPEVLFRSSRAIYHLSLNNKHKVLLFNLYKDNANVGLHSFSFIDEQFKPIKLNVANVPEVIKQHFYDENKAQLVFVGIKSRLPVIYGYRFEGDSYDFEITGFDNINSITSGKYDNTLLVAGSYQQIRGVWSVNTMSGEVALLLNANEDVISSVSLSVNKQSLFYTSESHRQDIFAVDWQGKKIALPQLNSTLIEGQAQYSSDNASIYFASDRGGDRELYQYELASQNVKKITDIKASAIWHYSFSHKGDKLAIVFSTDYIQLAIIDVKTKKLINSIKLEEIKFPLAWSKDDQSIYVSEHRSLIAMYLYEADTLNIKQTQLNLGLSAVELKNNEIIAFDYTRDQFVRYNFNDNTAKPISSVVANPNQLAPKRVYVDKNQAYIIETHNESQELINVQFSDSNKHWQITQTSKFVLEADVQAINTQNQQLLYLKDYNIQNGSIIELTLQP